MMTNSFGNQKYMQPMGRLKACTRGTLNFFLLSLGGGGGGWGGGRIFFHFPFVPNIFLSSSQKCSLSSQCVPNSTLLLSHMFCPKSSPSRLYRWAKGGGTQAFNRIFYFEGASIVSTFFCNGPIKISCCKKRKKKLDL
jgi:hypothetical protein